MWGGRKMYKTLLDAAKAAGSWVDSRIGLSGVVRSQLTEYKVPGNLTYWHSLGGLIIFIFVLQVLTGIFLLMYYIPEPSKAFESVSYITEEVPYGWFYRRVHAIGASGMVLIMILHMVSVMFYGSYKRPREMNWISGFILLNIVLMVCLTGYLLPWSQLSYWATVVATNIPGVIPVIGPDLVSFIRGSEDVSAVTLNRFYALHVTAVPLLIALFIGAHIFLLRRTGIAEPGVDESEEKKGGGDETE